MNGVGSHAPIRGYLLAIGAALAALLLRSALEPWLGDNLRFSLLYAAIVAAVSAGGAGPGIVATLLGYAGTAALFFDRGELGSTRGLAELGIYLVTSGIIIVVFEALRRATRRGAQAQEQLRVTLASIGDGVITTDTHARITYLNPVAEELTGWSLAEATGRPLEEVFRIVNQDTRETVPNPVFRVLAEGVVVGLANHTVLTAKDGRERPIDDSAAPIKEADGTLRGVVLVFRDVQQRRELDRLQRELNRELEQQVAARTAALSASEERFRLLVDGTREYAIFMLDRDGRVVSWNPGGERIKGYRADDIIGQHFSRFYTPEDQARDWPAQALEIATREGKFEEEGWRIRKDGSRFFASVVITALHDSAGTIRGFGKVTRDVTERRQAEETERRLVAEAAARQAAEAYVEEIARQREQLRVTLSSIGDAVITTDPAGRITMLNPVAEELTGWHSSEAVGQPLPTVFRIVNELTRAIVEDPVAKVISAGTIVGMANHTILIARDGQEHPIDDSAAPIRDHEGTMLGVVLIFRDISARRLLERETGERLISEERLRLATQAGQVGVWEWDIKRNRVTWTEPIYHIHGLGRDQFDGTVEGFSRLVHPDDAPAVRAAIEGALAGTAPYDLELRVIRPGGEVRWIYTRATVQRRGDQAVRMIGATVDITERQRTAEELREAHNRKDEFLATLAHELRNPLAPIRNAVEILMNNPAPDPELLWSRSVIDRQVQHMTRLLEDLLDVSRISRGVLELRRERVKLEEVIDAALEASRPLIEQSRHTLTVRIAAEGLTLNGDPVRLAQVFSNLLNNAARYTEAGGHIEISAEPVNGSAVVTVRDSGVGISAEMLPRVFEMFVQGSPSWERARSGLGIGLALSQGIVQLHGGSIEARSQGQGQGAEFTVRLPVAPSMEPEESATPRPEREMQRKARRVLVADDLRDSADTLAMLLRLHGHEVQTAYDGEEAVARAREFQPDVLLLDLGMPRMGGDLACRVIRKQPWGGGIHIIALTGWGQESDRRRTEEAGFDEHLVKPVDPAVLVELLSTLSPRRSPSAQVADR